MYTRHTITKDSWDDRYPSIIGSQTEQPVGDHADFTSCVSGDVMLTMLNTVTTALAGFRKDLVQVCRQLTVSMQYLVATVRKLIGLPVANRAIRYTHLTVSTWDCSRWALSHGPDMAIASTCTYKSIQPTNTSWLPVEIGVHGNVNPSQLNPLRGMVPNHPTR